jgi:hypothetical protein
VRHWSGRHAKGTRDSGAQTACYRLKTGCDPRRTTIPSREFVVDEIRHARADCRREFSVDDSADCAGFQLLGISCADTSLINPGIYRSANSRSTGAHTNAFDPTSDDTLKTIL